MESTVFTGIVEERGSLIADPAPSAEGGIRLVIGHSATIGRKLSVGASLAVSGACLTVIGGTTKRSEVELGRETVARTRLGRLKRGDELNLETALRVGDPLGGHWVQGHVDGLAELVRRADRDDHAEMEIKYPPGMKRYIVEKGSVALDGVSLTVSAVTAKSFHVALIPHTLLTTTLKDANSGHRFHFEADVLAKYVERMLAGRGLLAGADGA